MSLICLRVNVLFVIDWALRLFEMLLPRPVFGFFGHFSIFLLVS